MNNTQNDTNSTQVIWLWFSKFLKRIKHTILVFIYGFIWGFCFCFSFLHAMSNNQVLDNAVNLQGYSQSTTASTNKNGEIVLTNEATQQKSVKKSNTNKEPSDSK